MIPAKLVPLCHRWLQSVNVVDLMMSLVPANDLIEQRLEQPSLVGDGVLADVNVDLLQRLLDDGRNLLPVHCSRDKENNPQGAAE